jgi:hypothetical protein
MIVKAVGSGIAVVVIAKVLYAFINGDGGRKAALEIEK